MVVVLSVSLKEKIGKVIFFLKYIRALIRTLRKRVSAKPYLSVESALPPCLSFLFLSSSRLHWDSLLIEDSPHDLPIWLSMLLDLWPHKSPSSSQELEYKMWPMKRCITHQKYKHFMNFYQQHPGNVFRNEPSRCWFRMEGYYWTVPNLLIGYMSKDSTQAAANYSKSLCHWFPGIQKWKWPILSEVEMPELPW